MQCTWTTPFLHPRLRLSIAAVYFHLSSINTGFCGWLKVLILLLLLLHENATLPYLGFLQDHCTPFYLAVRNNHEAIVGMMLQNKGVEVDAVNKVGL